MQYEGEGGGERAISEVSRLLNQAERWIREGDSENAAVKTRKATETILIDIFRQKKGHWPNPVKGTKLEGWLKSKDKGIGNHLDDITRANITQVYAITSYVIHAQEEFDLPESNRIRSALDTARDLQKWWLEEFHPGLENVPSESEPEPKPKPGPEPITTRRSLRDGRRSIRFDPNYGGKSFSEWEEIISTWPTNYPHLLRYQQWQQRLQKEDPSQDAPPSSSPSSRRLERVLDAMPSEHVYDSLTNLMEKAVEMVQADDGWATFSSVGGAMKQLNPGFKVTDHGFSRLATLFRSKEDRFMVSRRADTNHVRIRGENDPHPSWAYEDSDPKWLISDAIAYLADEEGWAYLGNLGAKMRELSPNFKVSDHGHQKFKHLIESYSPMFEFDVQGAMPGDTHFSRRVRVSPVRIVISSILQNSDDEGWCRVESAEQTIDSNYNLPTFFEDHGFTDLLSMAESYPQYFELDSSRGRVRSLPPYWVALEEAVLSLKEEQGWVHLPAVRQFIEETDPEFTPFRFGFSMWSQMFAAKDKLFELNQAGVPNAGVANNKTYVRMVPQGESIDYEGMTVKQLTGIARERGLSRYSKLRKADLIELIRANESD